MARDNSKKGTKRKQALGRDRHTFWCSVHISEREHCVLPLPVHCLRGCPVWLTLSITPKCMSDSKHTCEHTHVHKHTKSHGENPQQSQLRWEEKLQIKTCRINSAIDCPPMVQFVVIFLRFGLCRNNSSSLLVGSHVVYFSPMPVDKCDGAEITRLL